MKPMLAPMRSRAFRWLEITGVFANTGVWMVALVGGYIMERLTTSPALVTFASAMSPLAGICAVVFSGAVAESRDRRAILLLAKILLIASVTFLAGVAASGLLTPGTLLLGIAGMGVSNGMSSPSWWTTIANLVPPDLVPAAFSLDSFQWNIGQVVGPVVGGSVLRGAGTAAFFCVCGLLMVMQVGFLMLWRGREDLRLAVSSGSPVESLMSSVSAGWRYFSNTAGLRAVTVRTALYVGPGVGLGALLPLFAAHFLHTSALGYGLLLSVSGVGALVAAVSLTRLQRRLDLDALVAAATLGGAVAIVLLVIWPTMWAAVPVLFTTGACWVWCTVAFIIAARQVTPEWVQTRALSLFYVVLQAPFVIGGVGFGIIDTFVPLRTTLLIAAAMLLPGILLIPSFRLPVLDRSSLQLVATPSLSIGEHVRPEDGPVLVLVTYDVALSEVDEFLAAMAELRVVRRRLGASRWGVFQDVAEPGRFIETFLVASWQGYLLQREHYTKGDAELESKAASFHLGPGEPTFSRLVHPETVEAARARSAWRREMLRLIRPEG